MSHYIPEYHLLEVCAEVIEHLEELRYAWERGCISEHDGKGGTRSNRNAELLHNLRVATKLARERRRPESLIAEFFEQQLWQFISIDEWLEAHK